MKKITQSIILTLAFICTLSVSAQDFLDKFQNESQIETVIVNKKMFQMMSNVKMDVNSKENQAYINLIKKLDDLKVFTTKSAAKSSEMKTYVSTYVKTKAMEELMSVTDQGSNVNFYVNKAATNENIKELVMFVDGNSSKETVILCLTGSFSLNELSLLTNKMKLPIGNALNKVSK